ncbi:DEBR0S3_01574g1_1 [Brettanomyces bruxellensis]|uniref:DEBR0S3_01574g1_1 n=1 Tax=Dekkera bruxellensis TaxID=5007 RepID=A0A3F2Y9M7_DEKBR|nr:DEBR0S3_01574g1_1 [Brettanomyces bruxellensis]
MNTMPGSFYGSTRGRRIAREGSSSGDSMKYSFYFDKLNRDDKEKSRILNYTKAKASYKVDSIAQLHLFVLTVLLLVYLQDNSFLKLSIKGLLEYFLFHYNPADQKHLMSVLLEGVDADESAVANLEHQLQVWKKILLLQIFFINFLVIADHLFNREEPSIPIPQLALPFTWSGLWSSIRGWLNMEASYRLSIYSEGNRSFQFGSVFIDFIGEIKYSDKVFIIILDLLVPLIQYIMFQAIVGDFDGVTRGRASGQSDNGVTPLIKDSNEDGYQGTICAFTVDVFPKLTMRKMIKVFYD